MKGLVLLLCIIAIANANKIFVSLSGTDTSGCGTSQSQSCGSLFYAITQSSAGDVIYIYPGTYASSGMSATISHNLTITRAVIEEGPPIISFGNSCLPPGSKQALSIDNYSSSLLVEIKQITFADMACTDDYASIIYVESNLQDSDISAELVLTGVTFQDNVFTSTAVDKRFFISEQSIPIGLMTFYVPTGGDQIVVSLEECLFTHNNAIGVSSYGAVDFTAHSSGVYNSSFYDLPPLYFVESVAINFTLCGFNYNFLYDNPLASFMFINASSTGTRVTLEQTSFKDGFSPAIRLEGPNELHVHESSFYGFSNSGFGGEVRPPHVGAATCISYVLEEIETTAGSVHISDTTFAGNGVNEKNYTLPCVVGASGFSFFDMENVQFTDNGVLPLAITDIGKNGDVNIEQSTFTGNTARAIVFSAHHGNAYTAAINGCQFLDNIIPGDTIGAAIEVGSILGNAASSGSLVRIDGCSISDSNIGILVGQNEQVYIHGTTIDSSVGVDVKCYKGNVEIDGGSIDTSTIECYDCSLYNDNNSVCTTN